MSSPWPEVVPRLENRWWRLPMLVRSLLTIGSSVLIIPVLLGWALGGGYAWLVGVIAVVGVSLWCITEQRHRQIGLRPGGRPLTARRASRQG